MSIIFKVTDPHGRDISLTEEIWYGKILQKRPWMEGWEDRVSSAIETPSLPICIDIKHKNRNVYYRLLKRRQYQYIRVVVKFNAKGEGLVITAHPSDSGRSGEMLL